jgi:chromosomal replication initiator protein
MKCNQCVTDAVPEKAKTKEREIDSTIEFICNGMHVPISDLYSKKRDRITADCRNFIFYVLRNYYQLKLPYIGKMFGRDHTTVMAGIKSFNNIYSTDVMCAENANKILLEMQELANIEQKIFLKLLPTSLLNTSHEHE